MGRDESDAVLLTEVLVERVAVVGPVANHPSGSGARETLLIVASTSAVLCGEALAMLQDRKTMAVCDRHILLPFPRRVGPTAAPPFGRAEAGVDERF